jgi:penicillin-binding protein 1B
VPVKIKLPNFNKGDYSVRQIVLLAFGGVVLLTAIIGGSIFAYYYSKYERIVDERMAKPLFVQTAKIYAAPKEVRVGQKLSPRTIGLELREAGYSGDNDRDHSQMGTFSENDSSITIRPGPQSYHSEQGATVSFNKGLVQQITGDGGQSLVAYELEPWSPTTNCRQNL